MIRLILPYLNCLVQNYYCFYLLCAPHFPQDVQKIDLMKNAGLIRLGFIQKMHRLNLLIVHRCFLRSIGNCVKPAGKSACGQKKHSLRVVSRLTAAGEREERLNGGGRRAPIRVLAVKPRLLRGDGSNIGSRRSKFPPQGGTKAAELCK